MQSADAVAYRNKRTEKGICLFCSNKLVTKRLCGTCRNKINKRSLDYTKKIKRQCIDHYGGQCACCREENIHFLSIDHVNNDGNKQRQELANRKDWGGRNMYTWLKKNNYPEGYQVLCFNCNLGRSINKGICPHNLTL